MSRPREPARPCRCFNSPPEVINLVLLMYVLFLLGLRNLGGLLFKRGVDIKTRVVWRRVLQDGPSRALRDRSYSGCKALHFGHAKTSFAANQKNWVI